MTSPSSPAVQVPPEVFAGHRVAISAGGTGFCDRCYDNWPCAFVRGVEAGYAAALAPQAPTQGRAPDPAQKPEAVSHVGEIDPVVLAATWGTGYGSRKHLVDHDGVHQVREGRHLRTLVPALCSSIVYLDFVDTSPEWTASHQGRSLCTKCVKAAEKTGMVL